MVDMMQMQVAYEAGVLGAASRRWEHPGLPTPGERESETGLGHVWAMWWREAAPQVSPQDVSCAMLAFRAGFFGASAPWASDDVRIARVFEPLPEEVWDDTQVG